MSIQMIEQHTTDTLTGSHYRTVVAPTGASIYDAVKYIPSLSVGSLSATERLVGGNEVEQQFRIHAARWRDETGMWSSFTRKAAHPDYLRIVGLGKQVVPLILRELRDRGGQWYYALEAITGVNPVPPHVFGQIPRMKAAWLEWGRSRGFI